MLLSADQFHVTAAERKEKQLYKTKYRNMPDLNVSQIMLINNVLNGMENIKAFIFKKYEMKKNVFEQFLPLVAVWLLCHIVCVLWCCACEIARVFDQSEIPIIHIVAFI